MESYGVALVGVGGIEFVPVVVDRTLSVWSVPGFFGIITGGIDPDNSTGYGVVNDVENVIVADG